MEDNEPLRLLHREILVEAGYHVLAAADGDAAVEASRRHSGPLDVLVTDVVLPKLGGREVAARVAADHPGVRVLFTSGYTADADGVQRVLDDGLAFLPKPASPHALLEALAKLLVGGPGRLHG